MFTSTSLAQHLVASLAIAYVTFWFLYGRASLTARRARAVHADPNAHSATLAIRSLWWNAFQFLKVGTVCISPVVLFVIFLGFAGRERSGIIEPGGLFTISARTDASIAYLADGQHVRKGEIVARFESEALEHRIAGLKAKRQELIASREALKANIVQLPAEVMVRHQAAEQRLAQLDQKLADIDRGRFTVRQQIVLGRTAWDRARGELTARLPELEQTLASGILAHEAAARALVRIETLRERGFATATQHDQASVAESATRHRANSTREALASTRQAIEVLDAGYEESRVFLQAELAKLDNDAAAVERLREPVKAALDALRPSIEINQTAAAERRNYEVAAADARIRELDTGIATAMAEAQVRSPVSGRILYRNAASATLTGSLPLLVVTSSDGFLMRIDLPRDEIPALIRGTKQGEKIDVVVEDENARRLAPARLVRIDDSGIDPKRVTAVFGLDVPEDMLVRMALHGRAPRGFLRWAPAAHEVVVEKIREAFNLISPAIATAKESSEAALSPSPTHHLRDHGIDGPIRL